jgi:hypothetical protein
MQGITVQQLQTKVGNNLHGVNINEVPNFYDLCYSAVARLRAKIDFRTTEKTAILTVGSDVFSYFIPEDLDMNKVTDFKPYYTKYRGDFNRPQNIAGNELGILMKKNSFNIRYRNGKRELELNKGINNTYTTLFDCVIENATIDSATQQTLLDGRVLTNADGMAQPISLVLDPYTTKMSTTLTSNEIVVADETNSGSYNSIYGVNQWGQVFTTGSTTSLLSGYTFRMKAVAPTSPLVVQLFVASGGVPTGSALSTTTFQPGYFVDGEEQKYTWLFPTDIGVNPSTTYCLVFSSAASSIDQYQLQYANVDSYPYGDACVSSDSGASYTTQPTQDEKITIYEVGTAGVDGTGIGSFSLGNISPAFDLSGMKDVAKFRVMLTTQQRNNINKITFQWGTDSSNYYSNYTTETIAGGQNEARPNIYEFDWQGATITGSPDPTNIAWLNVIVEYNGTVDPLYFIEIKALLGTKFELSYYSKYWFESTDGTFLLTPQSATDILRLDTDEVEIFVQMMTLIVAQQVQGADSDSDVKSAKSVLFDPNEGLIPLYEENNPSRTIFQQIPYYQFNNNQWGDNDGQDPIVNGRNPDAGFNN